MIKIGTALFEACEELERESVERAKAVMECMIYAVNSTGDMKGE